MLKLDPNNKAAAQQLEIAKQKKVDGVIHERMLFAGMFDKFAKTDSQASVLTLTLSSVGLHFLYQPVSTAAL